MNLKLADSLNRKVYEKLFIAISLVSFIVWIALLILGRANNDYYELFFGRGADLFADTTKVIGYSASRNPYLETYVNGASERAYPPLTYVFCFFLSRTIDLTPYYLANDFTFIRVEPQLLIVMTIMLMVSIIVIYEILRDAKDGNLIIKSLVAIGLILSMPFLYTVERANTILVSMALNIYFIFNYNNKSRIKKELALIALAISAALKMTPAVLGILLLYNKQWKDAIRTVIYGIIFFFGPFVFLKGGFTNVPAFFNNIQENLKVYALIEGCSFNICFSSLFPSLSESGLKVLGIMAYILSAVILAALPKFKYDWQKICGICILLVMLPSHSGYYCILFILPAIIAFLNENKHHITDLIPFICFCLFIIHDSGKTIYVYGLLVLFIYMSVIGVMGLMNLLKAYGPKSCRKNT